MKRLFFLLHTGCVVTMAFVPPARGLMPPAPPVETVCRDRVTQEMVVVHDEYRAAVYGTVRGLDGSFIARTGGRVSKPAAGIFPTKKRLTSELVEPLVESYRTLRCRMLTVCAAMQDSFQQRSGAPTTLAIAGCDRRPLATFSECAIAGKVSQQAQTSLTAFCRTLVNDALTMERAGLKLAVTYDSWYRWILLGSGYTTSALERFPGSAFAAVRSMVQMLGKFHQIPCFLAQCDSPVP